jgi:hypothetical protein
MKTFFVMIFIFLVCQFFNVKSAATSAAAPASPIVEDIGNQLYDMLIKNSENSTANQWLDIVSNSNLPLTLFLPPMTNPIITDKYLLPYHVVPTKINANDLFTFPRYTVLQTSMPDEFITITDNIKSRFSINNIYVTKFDYLSSSTLSVHQIKTPMMYSEEMSPNHYWR